jgi:hypothetical protein
MRRIITLTTIMVLVVASAAAALTDNRLRRIKEFLTGHKEVPVISTTGRGTFTASINREGTEIKYQLKYSGLEGTITQSHIHFGPPNNTGNISVFLCSNVGAPAGVQVQPCPVDPEPGEIEGIITADDVIGPVGQGIEAGALGELLDAIRDGKTYVNIHSSKWPAGEIRSQIEHDDHDGKH